MQCAVITHPPGKNYGGILQAYALCSAVKNAGHEVLLVDGPYKKLPFFKKLTNSLKKAFGHDRDARFENLQKFAKDHLPLTPRWYGRTVPEAECIIVGSDQVWRPRYAALPGAYFLDFLPEDFSAKRIAYAASFGVDTWELSAEQTQHYGALVKKFAAVSVRESSGVELCRSHWQLDVEQMPDPTLLHSREFYRQCSASSQVEDGVLFAYFLDPDDAKKRLAEETAVALGVPLLDFMPDDKKTKLASVEDFLAGIDRARMILTDSFHGMVFSMIFQKPFAVTGNIKRGMARFKLAQEAGLGTALLTAPYSVEECLKIASAPGFSEKAQAFLLQERNRGREFLQKHIGGTFCP